MSLSRVFADAYADDGVLVNAVTPAAVGSPLWMGDGGLADQTGAAKGVLARRGARGAGVEDPARAPRRAGRDRRRDRVPLERAGEHGHGRGLVGRRRRRRDHRLSASASRRTPSSSASGGAAANVRRRNGPGGSAGNHGRPGRRRRRAPPPPRPPRRRRRRRAAPPRGGARRPGGRVTRRSGTCRSHGGGERVAALAQRRAQAAQVAAPRGGGDELERRLLQRPGDEEVVDEADRAQPRARGAARADRGDAQPRRGGLRQRAQVDDVPVAVVGGERRRRVADREVARPVVLDAGTRRPPRRGRARPRAGPGASVAPWGFANAGWQ